MVRVKIAGLLSLVLLAVGVAVPAAAAAHPVEDLGRVLCVGDSITHGKSSGSWRWELFKIFVDNGIRQQEVGVQSGNYNGRGGVAPGTRYRGVAFANRHAAQFSEKAAEVAGRVSEPSRMGGTGIHHWLRLDGKSDGTWQLAEGETPDTLFIALGTNDFVAEHSSEAGGLAAARKTVQAQLIGRRQGKSWSGTGDMDAIVDAMREANAQARIIAVGMPSYSDGVGRWCHKAITEKDYKAVQAYNQALRHWGRARGVAVVDMNAGFCDVTKAGAAVADMLVDQMHPNAQGNLIYAGNVAKQLGYAGRTAGLPRKAAEAFSPLSEVLRVQQGRLAEAGQDGFRSQNGQKLFLRTGEPGQGATVELRLGRTPALGGVMLASGGKAGTLYLRREGLYWKGKCLYSVKLEELSEPIRLAWVPGKPDEGIAGGFYVWVGDMLVGEALPGIDDDASGLSFCNRGQLRFAYDPSGAWAPPTAHFSATKN